MGIARGQRAGIALATIALLTVAGCVSFGVKSWGAASVEDLQAENAYVSVYMTYMTRAEADMKAFAPSGVNPGVCNIGGSKQGCYDADAQVVGDLTAMLSALQATKVPPRFVDADKGLRDALTKNITGLGLRNRAIASSDDALWQQGQRALQDAATAWTAAYAAFPADNRPPLRP